MFSFIYMKYVYMQSVGSVYRNQFKMRKNKSKQIKRNQLNEKG